VQLALRAAFGVRHFTREVATSSELSSAFKSQQSCMFSTDEHSNPQVLQGQPRNDPMPFIVDQKKDGSNSISGKIVA
jgi:hypothetical protein